MKSATGSGGTIRPMESPLGIPLSVDKKSVFWGTLCH